MKRYNKELGGVLREDPEGVYVKHEEAVKLFAPANRDELLQKALKNSEKANAALWRLRAAAEPVLDEYAEVCERMEGDLAKNGHPGVKVCSDLATALREALEEAPCDSLAAVKRDAVLQMLEAAYAASPFSKDRLRWMRDNVDVFFESPGKFMQVCGRAERKPDGRLQIRRAAEALADYCQEQEQLDNEQLADLIHPINDLRAALNAN